ncbi:MULTISPECIES: hypothetical protein [unclassified Methylobacterium]|uniref:hypothetical protein n=1 Tax=unclassified Methylobacterium TaxID=2615210 RepID=UPI001FEEFBF4|nr:MULTISPECIES: hypothetical protein [unclassified Methylobacterium]
MPYSLKRLAPGSFDLILDGQVVGSLVRDVSRDGYEGDLDSRTTRRQLTLAGAFHK